MHTSIPQGNDSVADSPAFESPVVRGYPTNGGDLVLTDESAATKTLIHADTTTAATRQIAVGFGASRQVDGVLVCGQRPSEWVLLGSGPANQALVDALDTSGHVSVVDITHSRALFRLTGDQAPSLLEKVCNLDWSDEMTPDGAVTSGSVAKVTCDLVRNDVGPTRSYLIGCDRSFGQYLFDALLDAGDEFDVGTG